MQVKIMCVNLHNFESVFQSYVTCFTNPSLRSVDTNGEGDLFNGVTSLMIGLPTPKTIHETEIELYEEREHEFDWVGKWGGS